jgi:hypothetical protein
LIGNVFCDFACEVLKLIFGSRVKCQVEYAFNSIGDCSRIVAEHAEHAENTGLYRMYGTYGMQILSIIPSS